MLKANFNRIVKKCLLNSLPALAVVGTQGFATAISPDGSSPALSSHYEAVPPLLGHTMPPMIMLAISNDHELSKKAYSDYSDLDKDGTLDTTYRDNFEYYGYFNPQSCYDYSAAAGLYSPNGDVASGGHRCSGGGEWSGNFLNWASMTRLDIVRKVLYGGKRSYDETDGTVLERAMIPNDVHAFVKTVSDDDISGDVADYTPFTASSISICNTTLYNSGTSDQSRLLDTALNPPLMRVASGNYPQWSSSEVRQCVFSEEGGGSSNGSRPSNTEALNTGGASVGSYSVRIAACVDGQDADADYCREYIDDAVTTVKPAGLLQDYGESDALRFGLITGSYNNNAEGGVLRRNVTDFVGGAATEVDLDTGIFTRPSNSIIDTLDSMRIAGWDFGDAKYFDCSTHSISKDTFKTSTADNRQCRDWGNPLSEIYLEALRYFAGATAATADFATDDSGHVSGMKQAAWSADSLLDDSNRCAECAIVVLSTGLNTFDADDLDSAVALAASTLDTVDASTGAISTTAGVKSWTKRVGDVEGITNSRYIVGNGGSEGSVDICDTKLLDGVNGLGDVLGLCPEIPQMEGSYQLAGLAYYGNNADLWPSLDGKQNVTTYAVALAENLPSFEITASPVTIGGESVSHTVSFVPACQANTSGGAAIGASGWNDCSLSDVTVVSQTLTYGHILAAWEDSHWGNDYDMDGIASIEYCTATGDAATVQGLCDKYSTSGSDPDWGAATAGQIQMRVSVPVAAAGNALAFGFVMNGSDSDGAVVELLRPGGVTINRLNEQTTGTVLWDSVRTFTAEESTGKLLENPLWYAAKYGAYKDTDNDGTPLFDSTRVEDGGSSQEWDIENNTTGASGSDGIPDAFFQVSDPSNLVASLGSIFESISGSTTSSSSAAVVANTAGGTGALYQAIYEPKITGDDGESVVWSGSVISYFIDAQSRFREDANHDQQLNDSDPVVVFGFDDKYKPIFDRSPAAGGASTRHFFSELDTLWNAADVVNAIADSALTGQRPYGTSAESGRFIKTWIDGLDDQAPNGLVDEGEFIDFVATTAGAPFNGALSASANARGFDPRRFLGFDSGEDVVAGEDFGEGLVNFVRGIDQDFSGWRSRQFVSGSSTVTKRLGDVVHSAPEVVARPDADYDGRYNDKSYALYEKRWKHRRQMIYVGGNDGMLHGFNGGFFQPTDYRFVNSLVAGQTAHPLGAEVWSYIPQALLPHLQWLKEENYPHVYYMDGSVEAFDVNIFEKSETHTEGWGTIIVATMRLGGGDISIDPNCDRSDIDTDCTDDKALSSAVVIFDVTDPESEPVLLAELSLPDLGYTTSKPTVIKSRKRDSTSGSFDNDGDKWLLVFGSGPAGDDAATKRLALTEGRSNQAARLFAVDITDSSAMGWVDMADSGGPSGHVLISETNSYVGDISAADWGNDFHDDSVYFGTVGQNSGVDTGHLFRMLPSDSYSLGGVTTLYRSLLSGTGNTSVDGSATTANQPFSSAPLPVLDNSGQAWVFAAGGRVLTSGDLLTTQILSMHGIIEPTDSDGIMTYAEVDKGDLVNSTDIFVYESGGASDRCVGTCPLGATVASANYSGYPSAETFGELRGMIPNGVHTQGWYVDLGADNTPGYNGQRSTLSAQRFSNMIVFDTYSPSDDLCDPNNDNSILMGLDMFTGTASPQIVFDKTDKAKLNDSDIRILTGKDLGKGQLVGISAHNRKIITQQGVESSAIDPEFAATPFGRRSWREIPYQPE